MDRAWESFQTPLQKIGSGPQEATNHEKPWRIAYSEPPSNRVRWAPGMKGRIMQAKARHILVPTVEACTDLKQKIVAGADFAEIAREHSQCPSGKEGGVLGTFSPGQMVREFDDVVFKEAVGEVHGPVQTQFGYHLVEILERTE